MTRIVWDDVGEKHFETGVDRGVLYPMNAGVYSPGVAWNGLTNVTESPSGAESNPLYADNIKYLNMMSAEDFGGTIEAYTYPDEFALLDGSNEAVPGLRVGQQARGVFGMCYRTIVGNDVDANAHGYKLHLVYGATASPSEKAYGTVNDSPEAITFSWEFKTTPVPVTGLKPSAILVIDSTKVDPAALAALELVLYGAMGVDPLLPLPDAVIALLTTPPAVPDPLALTASDPVDGAAGVAVGKTITLTFNNALLPTSINNVVVVKADGTPVVSVNSLDGAKKVMTVNPTGDLSAASTYIVAIGVNDVYGQALNTAINFGTA